jgi:hypothetical protein
MRRILGDISNSTTISRREDLAVVVEAVIDGTIHPDGDLVRRGAVLAQVVATGKYRAYAEGLVTTAFATSSTAFAVDPTEPAAQYFKAGDVIESTAGAALGTIATYNPTTGAGTLAANSAAVLATSGRCRLAAAAYALGSNKARVLQEEVLMSGNDEAVGAYSEGFFAQSRTTITAAALAAMSAYSPTTGEVRLK